MATKLFLTNVASDANPGTDLEQLASLTAGSGLATATTNTEFSPSACVKCTATAGGTILFFLTKPLQAVVIGSGETVTLNLWMAESNMAANAGPDVQCFVCNNDGTQRASLNSGATDWTSGVELPVTTRAAQNFTGLVTTTLATRTIAAGERIGIYVGGFSAGGTMAAGNTFSLGYNGPTGAADGDSWVQFTSTLLEQVITARPPSVIMRQAVKRASLR